LCDECKKLPQLQRSAAVSNRFPLLLDELFAGITHAANEYKVDVIGGDTTKKRINHQHNRNWRR
jgi:thiamine-monophosphate kinase